MLYRIAKQISRGPVNDAIRQFCEVLPTGARVLCVGSGGAIEDLVRKTIEGRNIDLVTTDIDNARKPDLVDDICQSRLPSASFSAVILAEVLEHVENPAATADEILRVLAPGGKAIVTVPFLFMLHDVPGDYFRFSRFALTRLFRKFDHVDIVERGTWFDAIAILVLRMPMTGGTAAKIFAWLLMPSILVIWKIAKQTSGGTKSWLMPVGYIVSLSGKK